MKINLVRSFMDLEGDLNLEMLWREKDGSVRFTGSRNYGPSEESYIEIKMTTEQVAAIEECGSVMEIYACYKGMEYF